MCRLFRCQAASPRGGHCSVRSPEIDVARSVLDGGIPTSISWGFWGGNDLNCTVYSMTYTTHCGSQEKMVNPSVEAETCAAGSAHLHFLPSCGQLILSLATAWVNTSTSSSCACECSGELSAISPASMLSTSNSSESDSSNIGSSSRAEEAAMRASARGVRWSELSDEDWECAAAVSSSPNRYICEPHDLSHHAASADAGPEPRGARAWPHQTQPGGSAALWSAVLHSPHRQLPRELLGRAALPNNEHTADVCPLAKIIYIACDKQHQIRHRALAEEQKADSVMCRRPFVSSEYAVTCYVMTQHQSGLEWFHSCFRRSTLRGIPQSVVTDAVWVPSRGN